MNYKYKNIIFFNSNAATGGVGRVMATWGEYFARQGMTVEIISVFRTTSSFDHSPNIKYDYWNASTRPLNLFLHLLENLRTQQKSVLVFNKAFYIMPLFVLAILLRRTKNNKYVYFIHGGTSDLKYFYSSIKIWLIYRVFDNVICLTDDYHSNDTQVPISLKRRLINQMFPFSMEKLLQKVVIIPNPAPFEPVQRSFLNDKHKKNIFLCVGRFDFIKGQDRALAAWKIVQKKLRNWELHFVGTGNGLASIKNSVVRDSVERVQFHGFAQNIAEYYDTAKILILPSREEGFGMVTYEAFAHGLPVLSFRTVGSQQTISHNCDGIVVDQDNLNLFSENMLKLAYDSKLRAFLMYNGWKKVKEVQPKNLAHHWDNVLERF